MERHKPEKHILEQYSDALARVKYLRESVDDIKKKIETLNNPNYYETDIVAKGRKGKKPLGNAVIAGFPYPKYDRLMKMLEIRQNTLETEEQKLLELITRVEEYIMEIEDIEIRNILSLYYVENLTWIQVSHRMNGLYRKKKAYTDSSCRQRHERFLKKM